MTFLLVAKQFAIVGCWRAILLPLICHLIFPWHSITQWYSFWLPFDYTIWYQLIWYFVTEHDCLLIFIPNQIQLHSCFSASRIYFHSKTIGNRWPYDCHSTVTHLPLDSSSQFNRFMIVIWLSVENIWLKFGCKLITIRYLLNSITLPLSTHLTKFHCYYKFQFHCHSTFLLSCITIGSR